MTKVVILKLEIWFYPLFAQNISYMQSTLPYYRPPLHPPAGRQEKRQFKVTLLARLG